jgi:hypothetical protein
VANLMFCVKFDIGCSPGWGWLWANQECGSGQL